MLYLLVTHRTILKDCWSKMFYRKGALLVGQSEESNTEEVMEYYHCMSKVKTGMALWLEKT